MADSTTPDELRVEDLRWLRALASSLVRDPGLADDVVQDTLVRTLERRPSDPSALRAWLAATLRNLVRQAWRGRERREAREAARPVAETPSTLDVVAELALHRRLVEHVDALEEPYRTAIVLRFLREQSPRDAARELGIPLKTFHTHVERGLARLRARTRRERESWAALVVLGRSPSTHLGGGLTPLVLSMKLKVIWAGLGLLLVGAAWWTWRVPRAEPAPQVLAQTDAHDVELANVDAGSNEERVETASTSIVPAETKVAAAAVEAPTVAGFVRELDGRGVSGVRVRFERETDKRFVRAADDPSTISGARGEFTLRAGERRGRISIEDATFATLVAPYLDGTPPLATPIVVVVPAREYDGRVSNEERAPLSGAQVEITLAGSFVQALDIGGVSTHITLPFAETRTDEAGVFRFEHVAATPTPILWVRADGYEPREVALSERSENGLAIVLAHAHATARTIHGRVVDAAGLAAEGAWVSLGDESVRTSDDGDFALEWPQWREHGTLRAVKPGALPAAIELEDALLATTPRSPVLLALGAEPPALRGRVFDSDGKPVAGAIVFSPDTTPFGSIEFREGEKSMLGGTTAEALLVGKAGPEQSTLRATCDDDGRFDLTGLLDRDYALFAIDPRTLAGSGRVDVPAGEQQARLVIAAAPTRRVAGRVLSNDGAPLADVDVSIGRSFPWIANATLADHGLPPRGPNAWWISDRASARTDTDGRFEIAAVVVERSVLNLRGRALVLSRQVQLHEDDPLDALEIRVDASSRFEIVLADANEADSVALETLDGKLVPVFLEVDGMTISAARVELASGRSGPVLVKAGEWMAVLRSHDTEVRRRALVFPPGGLHELRP